MNAINGFSHIVWECPECAETNINTDKCLFCGYYLKYEEVEIKDDNDS